MQLVVLLCCCAISIISAGGRAGLTAALPHENAGATPFFTSAGPLPVFAPALRYSPTILPTEPLNRFGDPLRTFELIPPLYPGGRFIRGSYGIESVITSELRRIAAQREREAKRRRVRLEQQAIVQNLRALQMEQWALAKSLGQIPQDAPAPADFSASLELAQPASPRLMLGPTGVERLGFIPGTNRIWWRQVIQARHDTAQEKFLQQRVAQLLAQRQAQALQLRRLELAQLQEAQQRLQAPPANDVSLSAASASASDSDLPSNPLPSGDQPSLLSLFPAALAELGLVEPLEPFPPPTSAGREAPSTTSRAADRAIATATLGGLGLAAPGATLGLGLGLAPPAGVGPGGAFGAIVGAPQGATSEGVNVAAEPDTAGPDSLGPGELAARLIFGNALAGETRTVSSFVSPLTGNLIVSTALQQATTAGAGGPFSGATADQAIALPSLSGQFSVFPSTAAAAAAAGANSPLVRAPTTGALGLLLASPFSSVSPAFSSTTSSPVTPTPSAAIQATSLSSRSSPSMSWSARSNTGRMARGAAGGPGVFGRALGGYPSASGGNRSFGGGGRGGGGGGAEGASFGHGSGRGRGRGTGAGVGFSGLGGLGASAQGGAFGRGGAGGFGRGFGRGGGRG